MRQFNILKGTRGWLWLYDKTIRWLRMRNEAEVRRRVQILDFWKKHGEQAAQDAFGVSRRTLFRWQKSLDTARGRLEALDPKSRAPKKRRFRSVLPGVETFIIRERQEHPRIGKKKLAPLLNAAGFEVSESYVGRVLADLKKRDLLPSGRKLSYYARTGTFREQPQVHRKKLRRSAKRGMELDTVIRIVHGRRRYVLTAIDVERKFAFARAYTSHSSQTAADFLQRIVTACPFPIEELQTDNGSEFAWHFEDACRSLGITHFHTYPRSPKMNPFIERFNRTLSEDFIRYHLGLLREDLDRFNAQMADWLTWYNTVRPHESLGLVSPLSYILSTLQGKECQMY